MTTEHTKTTRPVSAIQQGTVIDHITPGEALKILQLLSLINKQFTIMAGMNLPSKRFKSKDLIKIENYFITPEQANLISVFSPNVTISLIKNYKVTQKLSTTLPDAITNIFSCPNNVCISNAEIIPSRFNTEKQDKKIQLTCHYCEKYFLSDEVRMKSLC